MQILQSILHNITEHFVSVYNNPFSLFFNGVVLLSIFMLFLSVYITPLRLFLVRINFLEQRENPKGFLYLLCFIYLMMKIIQIFIFQIFITDGPSMKPTLHTGDVLMVDRMSSLNVDSKDYTRGSVIVINLKKKNDFADGKFLVKRLIGLPGDTIIMEDNKLQIITPEGKTLIPDESFITYNQKVIPNFLVDKLPRDQYFFMGDNRDESYDSRYFGTVHKDDIAGEAVLMIYPEFKFYPGKSFNYQ